jgi:hypothetical protein
MVMEPAVAEAPAEMRGLWVPAWEITSPQAVDSVVDKAVRYGFNALFVQVRFRGDRLYIANRVSSRYPNPEPVSPSLNQPLDKFDPLAYMLAKGHGAGLEVHAWVTVYVAANQKTATPPGHVLREHPDWVMTTDSGVKSDIGNMQWLDPGNPAVNPYLENVFCDLVSGYDVDGLHLDYVRYPGSKFGYNPAAVEAYQQETGRKATDDTVGFTAWRRQRIYALVSDLYAKLQEIRPDCALSAAVFGERERVALPDCLQDWGKWLTDGILDYAVTMSYSTRDEDIERQCTDYEHINGNRYVYVGLGVLKRKPDVKKDDKGKNSKEHSTAGGDASGAYDPPESILSKIAIIRKHGLPGLAIFSSETLGEDSDLRYKALAAGPFALRARVPAMPWKQRFTMYLAALSSGGKQVWTVVTGGGMGRRLAVLRAKTYAYSGYSDAFISREGELWRTCVGRLPAREDAGKLLVTLAAAQ